MTVGVNGNLTSSDPILHSSILFSSDINDFHVSAGYGLGHVPPCRLMGNLVVLFVRTFFKL